MIATPKDGSALESQATAEALESQASAESCRRAAEMFRVLADPMRLRLLALLLEGGEQCVTDIAAALDDNLPAVSQRLKLLRGQRVVRSRREGKHVYYALDDEHVAQLIAAGLEHAAETH